MQDRDGIGRLQGLRQAGSLKLLFPRPVGRGIEVVAVNTAGGITGGDRFGIRAEAGAGTLLTVTTQAAERAYRAQQDEVAAVENRVIAEAGAEVRWLPQETILFDRCALRRRLRIDLAPDARLLAAEPLIFGRAAMGEVLRGIRFSDRFTIHRDGTPLYLDGIEIDGDAHALMMRRATGAGAGAMASLVHVAPGAGAHLDAVRDLVGAEGGASLLWLDVLVLRVLAADGFLLRRALLPVLDRLSGGSLPRVWRF